MNTNENRSNVINHDFVPRADGNGVALNPERVQRYLEAIRTDLVLGEQIELAKRLVGELVEFLETDGSHNDALPSSD